jgi:hypothetical protein
VHVGLLDIAHVTQALDPITGTIGSPRLEQQPRGPVLHQRLSRQHQECEKQHDDHYHRDHVDSHHAEGQDDPEDDYAPPEKAAEYRACIGVEVFVSPQVPTGRPPNVSSRNDAGNDDCDGKQEVPEGI